MIGTTSRTAPARQIGTKSGTAKKPNAHGAARDRHENHRDTGTICNPWKGCRAGHPHHEEQIRAVAEAVSRPAKGEAA